MQNAKFYDNSVSVRYIKHFLAEFCHKCLVTKANFVKICS